MEEENFEHEPEVFNVDEKQKSLLLKLYNQGHITANTIKIGFGFDPDEEIKKREKK